MKKRLTTTTIISLSLLATACTARGLPQTTGAGATLPPGVQRQVAQATADAAGVAVAVATEQAAIANEEMRQTIVANDAELNHAIGVLAVTQAAEDARLSAQATAVALDQQRSDIHRQDSESNAAVLEVQATATAAAFAHALTVEDAKRSGDFWNAFGVILILAAAVICLGLVAFVSVRLYQSSVARQIALDLAEAKADKERVYEFGRLAYFLTPAGTVIPLMPIPPAQLGATRTRYFENGELVRTEENGLDWAREVCRQTCNHPDYGITSHQIIESRHFAGSPNSWQVGIDYLRGHFGVGGQAGQGMFCQSTTYPAVGMILAAIRNNGGGSPLPAEPAPSDDILEG